MVRQTDERTARARARSAEEKDARRRALLDAAAALFAEREFDAITVAEVAVRAGLAKGTVYLYVRTKEELFLALAQDRLADWLDALDARLVALRSGAGAAAAARALGATLRRRRELLRLLGLLHAVFERNVAPEPVIAFKQGVLARLVQTGAALERVVRLPAGTGASALLRIYALMLGLWQMAEPGPAVARALEHPSVRSLRLDFFVELEAAGAALLDGLLNVERR